MEQPSTPGLLTVIIGLLILIAPLSAATVTITPDPINENDPITISITDLADDSTFMIQIEAAVPLDADGKFSLSTNNLQIPFALKDGRIAIHAENVNTTNLNARMGGRAVTIYGEGEDGVVNIKENTDIPQGLIQYLTLNGEGIAGAEAVTTSMDLSGKKTGPENSEMTFTVTGLNGGTVGVKIYVDGVLVPTTEPTTEPTTKPTTSSPGSSSNWEDSTATPTSTDTKPVTISSSDRGATLTFDERALSGARTGDLAIMVSNRAVPENWQAVAGPYAVLPSSASFEPEATLVLDLDKAGADRTASLTILAFIDGRWKAVPSRIDGSTISTAVSEAGEFAIVTPLSVQVTPAAPAGTTPATTTSVATTAPQTTATTPTQSPLAIWCALGALAVVLITGMKRR
ncbi:hypothetical protein E2N92_09090 [Methanofollis formosanus]|uniref:Uncharacterized protein n=1 Tax=Methanofollis formosanus TaxID=299308 RepID=A0A8G1EG86_9EURY|nr:hypothetical protein [Methanofollis formosanus]QYZ79573.1 hypothetical protein E2N92_09090 [Methanofollis formosanus]